ncbi:MAG: hypothetical protein DDT34_00112 [Firmicutes bacterium]|nr:hypothetical protein [Bacillota bacterium]MBT9148179.1 hypothetical protein [Bacillota bacterium]
MATIRKQKVGKYTYWQIIESKRVDGKPRPVVVLHLGTAEQLLKRLTEGPLERQIRSASHGAVQLFWQQAEALSLPELFASSFSSQTRDGVAAGTSLLLAAIHRAIQPESKSAFGAWAKQTTLPQIAGFSSPDKMGSQHFWDQMDTVTDEQLAKVERAITQTLLDQGLLSSKLLFYDLTNFFTYISTHNEKASLAKRGKNKQKRNDLRQFGLAQVATKEFIIPVLSEVYEGNRHDHDMFVPYLTKIRERLSDLNLVLEEFTLVFDKGSNSKANFRELDKAELPYVASLTPTYHKDLLAIPRSSFESIWVNGKEYPCYRAQKDIWGKERTVIIAISEKLRRGQLHGFDQALLKRENKLQDLKEMIRSPNTKKRTVQDVESAAQQIVQGERCHEIIRVSVFEAGGKPCLEWYIDSEAYHRIVEDYFGKKLFVTCRENWTTEEIIAAYNGQSNIERVFKHLKNPYHNAVSPQYHWTDQKIKVHTFVCLIGLLLSQLLLKKAQVAGYNMSVESLIDRLTEVRMAEVITVVDLKKKPQIEVQLENMDAGLQELYNAMLRNGV